MGFRAKFKNIYNHGRKNVRNLNSVKYKFVVFREHCLQSLETINWKRNFDYPNTITIEEAIDLIVLHGKDAGKSGAYQLMPSSKIFNEWVSFYKYVCCAELYIE